MGVFLPPLQSTVYAYGRLERRCNLRKTCLLNFLETLIVLTTVSLPFEEGDVVIVSFSSIPAKNRGENMRKKMLCDNSSG